jgi:RNA polymerase sigma-70 factor (ECF subfamily)
LEGSDDIAFTAMAERHRRELQVHCYRMTGSLEESEDLVQETFLRAWRARRGFRGRASLRTWLYRIATNACLDALERRPARVLAADVAPADPAAPDLREVDLPWLQPYPDALLDAIPDQGAGPAAAAEAKETIELAFMAAIQHLPPRQRAALILRDVLGWPARETAAILETTVAAANSALQRARATLRDRLPAARSEWRRAGGAGDRRVPRRHGLGRGARVPTRRHGGQPAAGGGGLPPRARRRRLPAPGHRRAARRGRTHRRDRRLRAPGALPEVRAARGARTRR